MSVDNDVHIEELKKAITRLRVALADREDEIDCIRRVVYQETNRAEKAEAALAIARNQEKCK